MFSAAFFIMCFYPLSDLRFLELVQEIKERRQRLRLNRDREASHDTTIEKAPR
jgi:Na+/melibiose symporter-like transporter